MAVYTVTSGTLNNTLTFFNTLMSELTNGNSTQWFSRFQADINTSSETIVILESKVAVDLLLATNATQHYYLIFRATKSIPDPTLSGVPFSSLTVAICTNEQFTASSTAVTVSASAPIYTVFNAANRPTASDEFSYRLSLTSRGFALGLWKNASANLLANNFFLVIQRPVNPSNGAPKINGKAPIFFLVHQVTNLTAYFDWGIVRETDRNTCNSMGTTNLTDTNAYLFGKISMEWPQPNLFDNNSHVVKFPFGFATSRSLYMEEMDLMCLVSSASFSVGQDINITMYGESTARKYVSSWGAMRYGSIGDSVSTSIPNIISGARIGILTVG